MPDTKKKWRLKKTLKRRSEARPIEREDIKYAWAAYKKGHLASMGERFASGEMDADAFTQEFEGEILTNYHAAWTLFAESHKGYMPVGLVLGFWSHPNPEKSPFMNVGDVIWFPWASPRNRVEAGVRFFNDIRSEIPMIEYAGMQDKRYFEIIAKHGVMRRVGTSHNVYAGQPAAIFETRGKA